MGRAFVLLSGGVDSSTCLAIAKKNHEEVTALLVNYNQRHRKELEAAYEIADYFNIPAQMMGMTLGKGGLTDEAQIIPQVGYDEIKGVSPSYVPFRNGSLLALAASQAQADPTGEAVYYGAHAEDAQNWAYPCH